MSTALWSNSKFYGPELLQIVDSVAGEKGLDKGIVISAIEEAVGKAAKTKYGHEFDIKAKIDNKTGAMSLLKVTTVVDDNKVDINEYTERKLSEARKINSEFNVGDVITEELPPIEFGRWAAQIGRQAVTQIFKSAERIRQYEEFKDRVGTIVSGIVKRSDFNSVTIEIGRTEAVIKRDQLIPRENFRVGDRIRAYIVEVSQENYGPQVLLSRTHPQFLVKLFTQEVPEIYDGIIEIKSASRDPGSRAKIAVYSSDKSIDPIGACVGVRGSRVQAIVQELQGEKIDIVLWSSDIATFAVNALAPAEVSKVVLDEENKMFEVLVPDDQLSLAIGRRGQNVKLASQLINWKLEVVSESDEKERKNKEYHEKSKIFMDAIGCDEMLAHLLVAEEFTTIEELAYVDIDELSAIEGIGPEVAESIQNKAKLYLEEREEKISSELNKYDFDPMVAEIKEFSAEDLLNLCKNNILDLKGIAELANDELVEIVPSLSEDQANEIIMAARKQCKMI